MRLAPTLLIVAAVAGLAGCGPSAGKDTPPLWIIPDMNLDHNASDGTVYKGNYHEFMLRQPGGSNDPNREVENAT